MISVIAYCEERNENVESNPEAVPVAVGIWTLFSEVSVVVRRGAGLSLQKEFSEGGLKVMWFGGTIATIFDLVRQAATAIHNLELPSKTRLPITYYPF